MNKLQVVGLKKTKMVAAVVEYNHEEIKAVIDAARKQVENEVVTLDSIKPTKKTMSDINKLVKEIDTFRKDTKKELTASVTEFETQTKGLVADLKETRTLLSDQVDKFEEEERERKRVMALQIIEQTKHEIELTEKYIAMIEIKDSYLLAASNPTKVKKLIVEDFKRVKVLQNTEQTKIDTIHMIIGAHNQRLRFKFSFDDFERFINDETPLMELNQIVNDTVNKRLADEKAELERIAEEKKQAVEDERLRVKKEAEEKAEEVRLETERKQQAKLAEIELENKKAIAKVETIRRLEQDKRDREAEIKLQEQEEQTQATLQSVSKELEKMDDIIIVEAKEEDPIVSFKFELSGTAEQIETAKRYFDTFNLKYEELF